MHARPRKEGLVSVIGQDAAEDDGGAFLRRGQRGSEDFLEED